MIGDIPHNVWSMVELYLLFLAMAVGYAFVTYRLRRASQLLRLRFVEKAEYLRAAGALTPDEEEILEAMTENTFNGWMPWVLVVGLPVAFILDRLNPLKASEPRRDPDSDVGRRLSLAQGLWLASVCSYSPLPGLIVAVELMLVLLVTLPFQALRSVAEVVHYFAQHAGAQRSANAGG